MRTRTVAGWTAIFMASLASCSPPPEGEIEGAFTVNNLLPEPSSLIVELRRGDDTIARQELTTAGDSLPFDLTGLESGSYSLELLAETEHGVLRIGRIEPIEVDQEAPTQVSGEALGVDGEIAGTIRISGDPPADRLLLVRAERTDVEIAEAMPDELNRLSFEVPMEEISAGEIHYAFENTSYGIFRVELIGYDYSTHQIESYGRLTAPVRIDLDHRAVSDSSFEITFGGDGS